jgi:ribonuclease HII
MLKSYNTKKIICGCDESGRGSLAGPVFASAVILPKKFKHELLNDSKKISKKSRDLLRKIIEKEAIFWSVSKSSERRIEEINILNASIEAMHKSINKLKNNIDLIIVDGNRFKKYKKIRHECIVKGDQKYKSIAAASILAKTHRDEFMMKLHLKLPQFLWNKNKGYPTKTHKEAIAKFGISKFHRKTFNCEIK